MVLRSSSLEVLEARIAPASIVVSNLNDMGDGSLRTALAKADSSPGKDTITFHLPPATGGTENMILLASSLTSKGDVTIKGPGAGKLIISGGQHDRVFNFNDNTPTDHPVSISGVSIVDGKTTGTNNGGGIFSSESLTLTSVVVEGNTAHDGGGVAVGNAAHLKVNVSKSIISGNSASVAGGGLDFYVVDSVKISKTTVSGNSAVSAGAGGIYASLSTTGTGISITGSTVTRNEATHGGGIFLYTYTTSPTVKLTISSSTVSGNEATGTTTGGGGVYAQAGNVVITGSTISNNYATYEGGGVEAHQISSLTISKSTISGNHLGKTGGAQTGGAGVFIQGKSTAGTLLNTEITSSTISGNISLASGGGLYAVKGVSLSISKSAFNGNQAKFEGGGVATYATNAANTVNVTVSASTFSGNLGGAGGGFYAGGPGTVALTKVTAVANTASGGGGGFEISSPTTALLTNVIATGNVVTSGTGVGGGLKLSVEPSFTITGGTFSNNVTEGLSGGGGGGIGIINSTGIITKATISGNTAKDNGGGLYAFNSASVTVSSSKITGNTSINGAGGGVWFNGTALILTTDTFTGDEGGSSGGGVYTMDAKTVTISGGTFTGNTALVGGAIEVFSDKAGNTGSITGVSITGNSAVTVGGVFNGGGTVAALTLQIAKVIANTSQAGNPNFAGSGITTN